MRLPPGYAGNTLVINLTKEKVEIRSTGDFFEDYGIDPRPLARG